MDLWLAALIIVGVSAVSAAAMLVVRRHAPAGTFFRDVVPAGRSTPWSAPRTW
jgi:hypothetical protein